MSTQKTLRLGEILIQKGWITKNQLEEALQDQKASGEFLGALLLRKKYITEEQLVIVLSEQFQMPWISLKNYYVDWDLVMRFSAALISEHKIFPLQQEETSITFAVANPLDAWGIGQAEEEARAKGRSAKFFLGTESDVQDLLQRYRQYVKMRIKTSLEEEEK